MTLREGGFTEPTLHKLPHYGTGWKASPTVLTPFVALWPVLRACPRRFVAYFCPFIESMRMSAISGRVNSTGGRSPLTSISRTLVPDSDT